MRNIRSEYAANVALSVRPSVDPLIAYAATQRAREAVRRHRRAQVRRMLGAVAAFAAIAVTGVTTTATVGLF